VLHHILLKTQNLDDWKEVIQEVIEAYPILFSMKNHEGVSPEMIDIERQLGV